MSHISNSIFKKSPIKNDDKEIALDDKTFGQRKIEISSKNNKRVVPSSYFSDVLPFEIFKQIFSYSIDERLIILSRTSQYLHKIVNSFLSQMLTEDYNDQSFFEPFKNKLADFLYIKSSIAVIFYFYSLKYPQNLSCISFKKTFEYHLSWYINSWSENGFIFTKSDDVYTLAIDDDSFISLSEKEQAAIFILGHFFKKYYLINKVDIRFIEKTPTGMLSTIRSFISPFMPKYFSNNIDAIPEQAKKALELINFASRHRLTGKGHYFLDCASNFSNINSWAKSGFIFSESDDGYEFMFDNTSIKLKKSDNTSLLSQFCERYFLSQKIISDFYLKGSAKVLSLIEFLGKHKAEKNFSNIISKLFFHFYEQCHYNVYQIFWPWALNNFLRSCWIDELDHETNKIAIKNYAVANLKDCQGFTDFEEVLTNLLSYSSFDGLLDSSDANFLMGYIIEKLKLKDISWRLEYDIMSLFDHILDQKLIEVNHNDTTILKGCLFTKIKDSSSFKEQPIRLLQKLSVMKLIKINSSDSKILKDHMLTNLLYSNVHYAPQYLISYLKNNLVQLSVDDSKFLKDHIIEKFNDPLVKNYLLDDYIDLFNQMLKMGLIKCDVNDIDFLKIFIVEKCQDPQFEWPFEAIQNSTVNLLNQLMIMNFIKLNVDDMKFFKTYIMTVMTGCTKSEFNPELMNSALDLLDLFLQMDLIEEDIKKSLKNFVFSTFKDLQSDCSLQHKAIKLLDWFLTKNLASLDIDNITCFKDYVLEWIQYIKYTDSNYRLMNDTLELFNKFLASKLIAVDANDARLLKDYMMQEFNDSFIDLLNQLLTMNLAELNADDKKFFKDLIIAIINDPSYLKNPIPNNFKILLTTFLENKLINFEETEVALVKEMISFNKT